MGVEIVVDGVGTAVDWPETLRRLVAMGAPSTIVMVDGALVMPTAAVPAGWSDVRLKTAAGTFAVKRQAGGRIAVVAFGNADAAVRAMQEKLAAALSGDVAPG